VRSTANGEAISDRARQYPEPDISTIDVLLSGELRKTTVSIPPNSRRLTNLTPLFDGIDGSGKLSASSDSFGSPTTQQDLNTLRPAVRPAGSAEPDGDPTGRPGAFVYPTNIDSSVGPRRGRLELRGRTSFAPVAALVLGRTPCRDRGVQGFPAIVAAENFVVDP